jgi:hypothetical protein
MHEHFVRSVSAMSELERDALLTGLPALIRAMRADTFRTDPADAP